MSRWPWLKEHAQRLKYGSLEQLYADLTYCSFRENLSSLKSHIKTWQKRRLEVERTIAERFGEEALASHCEPSSTQSR